MPVLFYVHGGLNFFFFFIKYSKFLGGFLLDSSTILGDENICKYLCAKHNIIVVTFNYRLGFFGLLTLDSKETPGNYALWDMTMALRWTNENIKFFGGDPNRITVSGQSAGAVAVDYLSISPHSMSRFLSIKFLKITQKHSHYL